MEQFAYAISDSLRAAALALPVPDLLPAWVLESYRALAPKTLVRQVEDR